MDGALWSWDAAFAVSVDPESGEVLKRIDLFEVHEENQDIDIYGIWRIDSVDASNWASDPMHANDVEPLPASLASALLMFEPGDLLISMRDLNLLSVVDPDTVKVKWKRFGIGRRLRKPDRGPDGTIVFFDNNTNPGHSRLRSVDPSDYSVTDIVKGEGYEFFSPRRGRHSVREDGSVVVVSAYQGRLFEVDPSGDIVFEFVNKYEDGFDKVARISDGLVLPPDYFETMPRCENNPG